MLKTYVHAQTYAQSQIDKFKDHLASLKTRFEEDQDGAALIEYSILIGLITVAAIVAIIAVGKWVANQWNSLKTQLGA